MQQITINCDGGARGNPGPAASAYVITDASGTELKSGGKYLGPATNNIAEYTAVIEALTFLSGWPELENLTTVNFKLDSQLVVSQINGLWKIKDDKLRNLIIELHRKEAMVTEKNPALFINYNYVPREENSRADLLVNQTLDDNLV